ncbi:uncharacterized protein [Physcomitrium patens]|uniref:uncharacterized protein n=1 Tax=Physcomitrium patens TaxID=3218 RepID=UPI00024B01ED|nr:uncharacterized protein LOC112292287 [Physcomitrium patens]XP_024396372.1 uncharacterized protein LOC112292287 [Physcomitrium patens]XP_024396373.1 uncharacterized protein LOC112292287 [Physcomitrium patens]XP_024396374.1 uncharacterized protein LOC112292287 [Physcomitrium patens]|eukprot:XP_024396371.1 uncharacterized protein LOC112292287 [Physcomitrella patens]
MFSMLDWFWLIKLSILCMRCMYGCGNCFGRFTKSQKLDLRTTQDFLGADIGEAVPLNNPLGTSSSNEMENNGSNSCQQRPSSSIDANHLSLEAHSPAENDVNSPYVNHALRRWTEERREWLGNRERPRPKRHREPVISWSTTYEDLLGTSRPFSQLIPLPEMVDFLVDVWEQEGLYE